MTCAVIGWVDTWALAASLRGRRKELRESATVWPGKHPDWPAMRQIVNQLASHAERAKADLVSVELTKIEPQQQSPWERDDARGLAILPIVTNPAAYIFAGPRAPWHAEAGSLVLVDQSWPVTVVNWGTSPHIHLTAWLSTVKDER